MITFFYFFLSFIVVAIVVDAATTIKALKRLEKSQERTNKAIEELKKQLR